MILRSPLCLCTIIYLYILIAITNESTRYYLFECVNLVSSALIVENDDLFNDNDLSIPSDNKDSRSPATLSFEDIFNHFQDISKDVIDNKHSMHNTFPALSNAIQKNKDNDITSSTITTASAAKKIYDTNEGDPTINANNDLLDDTIASGTDQCHQINTFKLSSLFLKLRILGYEAEPGWITFNAFNHFAANPQGLYGMYKFNNLQLLRGTYTLAPSDAVLFLGCSPPKSRYWGIVSYLLNKQGKLVFGSLGDSINQLVAKVGATHTPATATSNKISDSESSLGKIIVVDQEQQHDEKDDKFNKPLAFLTTGDATTFSDVENALKFAKINIPLNLDQLPTPFIQFASSQDPGNADILSTLFRLTISLNDTEFNKYISRPRQWIWKLRYVGTHFTSQEKNSTSHLRSHISKDQEILAKKPLKHPRSPYPVPDLRSRITNKNVEGDDYARALERLREVVRSSLLPAGYLQVGSQIERFLHFDGFECIEKYINCGGDNHDASYYSLGAFSEQSKIEGRELQFNETARVFVLIGVNHRISAQAIYANIGLSKASGATGFSAIPNADINDIKLASSAKYYLPKDDDYSESLFVLFIVRDCVAAEAAGWFQSGTPCIGIPTSEVDEGQPWVALNRVYLNPVSKTGPSQEEVLPYELLVFA